MGMVESGAGGAGRDAEDLGDLARLEARVMAQHEDGALLWIESAEAALQLVAVSHRQELVGTGREIRREHVEIGDEAPLAHCLVKTRANDEAMEPRVEPFRIAESGQVAPSDHQRFLDGILGSVDVAEDPLREREESVATRTDQVGVCLPVAASGRLDEIAIHVSVPSLTPSGGVRVGGLRRPIFYGTASPPGVQSSARATPSRR